MPENFTPHSVEIQNRIQLAAARITGLLLPSSLVATLCDELEFEFSHLISYNLVRAAMVASALRFVIEPEKLSFTGAMQALEEFAATLRLQSGRQSTQWNNLLQTIRELTVGERPGRLEPRLKKRRPKNYKLMREPRQSTTTRKAIGC